MHQYVYNNIRYNIPIIYMHYAPQEGHFIPLYLVFYLFSISDNSTKDKHFILMINPLSVVHRQRC